MRFLPLILVAILLACPGISTAQKRHGGTYRMAMTREPYTLEPWRIIDASSSFIAKHVFDRLVDYDSSLALTPRLALRWEVSPNGRTYTYHLRRDVYFHDDSCFKGGKGRRMTAADVKYCFDRLADARTGSINAYQLRELIRGADAYYLATERAMETEKLTVPGVSGFRAVNDSTFTIELLKPFAPFKHVVALASYSIYPREAVEQYPFSAHLVGTGAFRESGWEHGRGIALARNEHYWRRDNEKRQLPYLDSIAISFDAEDSGRVDRFLAGDLDELYRPPESFRAEAITPAGDLRERYARFTLRRIAALSTQFYGMLTTRPPFNDSLVRQAFNYAIDREKLVTDVLQGTGMPALHGVVPPGIPGYATDSLRGYRADKEKARELLARAGYPGGKDFPKVELYLNQGGARNAMVAEGVAAMIEDALGIHVELSFYEFAQFMELVENGKSRFFRTGWIGDYPDPSAFLELLYGGSIPGQGPTMINTTRYANPAFDELFERARSTRDDSARFALYRRAEQIALDGAPIIPLFHDVDYLLLQPNVRGAFTHGMDYFDYAEIWLER